jgi:hypothetical protein
MTPQQDIAQQRERQEWLNMISPYQVNVEESLAGFLENSLEVSSHFLTGIRRSVAVLGAVTRRSILPSLLLQPRKKEGM